MRSASQSMLVLVLVTLVLVVSYVGSASAEVIEIEGATGEPGIRLQSQGVAGVEIRHEVHSFAFEPLEIDGETMQKICLPNVFLPNNAGAPDLPGESRLVGLPEGATATLEIVSSRTLVYHNVEVAPAPVIPLQNDDSPLVYQKDLAIYTRNALYPSSPALISEPHQMRGVDVVAVGITPFQYNPVTKELIVYTELEVRVAFHGGNGLFGEDRLRNRYWEPILESHLINYASLPKMDFGSLSDSREGYEYVIITPDNPDFIAWGDTLKAWRKLQGISTEVFTTSDIGGTSAAEIEAWLDNAYNSWDIPPVAFMILGDYPESGDRDIGITSPIYNSTCVSDNIYADVDGDHLPEMAHGRITARGAAELETMIIKMLSYEREPYTDPDFYDHPIMAGGWQTDRWFILCTEIVFGFQTNILGKDPVREYAIFTGTPGTVWSTSANTDILVDYFGPNGLGYIPATPEHLTDWGGNAERLNTDINSGAYMLLHRDHGWMDGWGEPDYHIPDLAGLSNDLFPFVFSINCLTGMYNWESECFTEAFHRMVHGALGVIAASETSYSFVNDTFIWGMFDELWPEFMPDYPLAGSDNMGSTNLRTAWGMISGKWFLFGSEWPWNTGNKEVTYHLFHHHGDAFLTMYSEVPQELDVFHYDSCPLNTDMFAFQANAGAVVALTVDGEIIGVADATGAPQTMSIIPQTQPGTLRITVTNANYFRYDETIPIGGTAYLVKPDGTGDFATIQAAIDAVAEGVTIELADGTYTGEGNRDVDFIGKAVTVRSRYGNPEACIIDAEGLVADPHRGFQFVSGEGSGTLLAGVKILGGVYENGEGAGILCHGSSPRIEHCAITGNLASNGLGGGLACMAGASPSVVACTFEANEGNLGGGIYCASGSPALEGCTFKANIAADGGGGAHFTGNGSLPTLDSSTFWSNEALTGGGVACTDSAAVTVTHCTFYDDFAYEGAAVSVGTDASAILENNIVAFGREGAGIACDGSGASASLTCCDLYNNAGGDWVGCIADQYGINGNIAGDPLFCEPESGDFSMHACSPCAPDFNPACGLIGAWPVGCWPGEFLVKPDGTGDFATIQDAIDATYIGDLVELDDGTFTGEGNRDIDFLGKPITVRSKSGDAKACVIDCEATQLDPHRGFLFQSGEEATSVLEGIAITNGYAPEGGDVSGGGAIACANNSSPTVISCIFAHNFAYMEAAGVLCEDSSPTFTRCTFAENQIDWEGWAAGIMCNNASPTLTNCTFYANEAWTAGSVIGCRDASTPTLDNTIIAFNVSSLEEPPVSCDGTSSATLGCCDVYGNVGGDWVGCIEGQLGINENFCEDPVFCDPELGDLTIRDDSPCAPDNNPACGLIGAWPVACGVPVIVKPDGTGDFPTIQAAIDAAFDGGMIELTDGVFTGEGNRDISFLGKVLTVRSQSRNPEVCIIDCEGSQSEPHRGFRFDSGEGHDALLEGVTVKNAHSTLGGAIYCLIASPTLVNCILARNSATGGAAVYCYQASPTIDGCTIVENSATSGAGFFCIDNANPELENTIIAFSPVGSSFLAMSNSIPVLACCDIYGNAGGDWVDIIADQLGVNGNICADPMFCAMIEEDYAIDYESPCAPDNSPAGCDLIGALGIGCGEQAIDPEDAPLPTRLSLAATAPSSSDGTTRITYAIPGTGTSRVTLKVYDPAGRLVRTLVNAKQPSGNYAVVWSGTNENGARIESGIYFARLTWSDKIKTRSLVLIK